MAWYRAGGGGIPSSLKTDMNDVLNKKFGTSQDYPPTDWAPTVNLMGPLPEKTASGAIVTFSDGADAVPLKKCEVSLPASLDGYSEIDVVSAGKNLINVTTFENKAIGADGTITNANTRLLSPILRLKSGTYFINFPSGNTFIGFAEYNGDTWVRNVFTNNSVGISIQPQTDSFRLYFKRNDNGDMTPSDISTAQLEAGNQQTAHVPYTAPTTHTASLGRTIHGGTADVVKGQGESLCGKIVFDGSESRWSAYTTGNGYAIPLSGMKRGTWYTSDLALSYPLPKAPNNDNLGVRIGVNNDGIYVVQANTISGVTDLASFKAWLAENPLTVIYPLDDSETFTFDPISIDSKLGNNTIWSEQGSDTEVTYRGQGTITPILPTLVTKTITENGTYSAEDDDADGYSEVTVNVESLAKIGINSGKLNISNGEITADSAWCYTDTFDCPSGTITLDVGEGIVSDFAGIELIYESDGSHANYWQGNNRFREVDLTNYYSATKKARLAFKKQYLSKVLLMDFGNGKIYSPLSASQLEETQASLLSMNSTERNENEETTSTEEKEGGEEK